MFPWVIINAGVYRISYNSKSKLAENHPRLRPRFIFVGAGFVFRIQLSESRGGGHYLRGGILPATYAARGYLLTGVRECALSLGKRSTFPDGVLAFRTPLRYQAAHSASSRPPHFRSLLSLSFTHKSRLRSASKVQPRSQIYIRRDHHLLIW